MDIMTPFNSLQLAMSEQFKRMQKYTLFQSNMSKSDSSKIFLNSFEEGTDPLYVTNTEHNCNCCISFLRSAAGILAIIDGKLVSIWDLDIPGRYQPVVNALSKASKAAGIASIYVHSDSDADKRNKASKSTKDLYMVGRKFTKVISDKDFGPNTKVDKFDHFHLILSPTTYAHMHDQESAASRKSTATANYIALAKGLSLINLKALEQVQELLDSNQLLQPTKAQKTLNTVRSHLRAVPSNSSEAALWLWETSTKLGIGATYSNSLFGTLLKNLSKSDADLTYEVNFYNQQADPTNYKRSNSVITPAMQKKAAKFVEDDGCADSLPRRTAKLSDITINNLRYASTQVKESLGVLDVLNDVITRTVPDLKNVPTIEADNFLLTVVPEAKSIEMLVTGALKNNFMSLVAPVNPDAPSILAWNNNFSHVYDGDLTDVSQIKENVKSAGGNVDGDFRASLSWNEDNLDKAIDLDAHLFLGNGTHIYYSNAQPNPRTGGHLDVDNTHPGHEVAVENITYSSVGRMEDTTYKVYVHNFSAHTCQGGFSFEIELLGEVYTYAYKAPIPGRVNIDVATVTLKNGKFTIKHHLEPSSVIGGNKWNVAYDEFIPVKAIMDSPNYWDDNAHGEPHVLFMLNGCINPDPVRGLFTEFLHPRFHNDRKTFEILGHKLRAPFSKDQLSGIGVSANVHPLICFKVDTDQGTRLFNVQF